jgi:hypothetical protein
MTKIKGFFLLSLLSLFVDSFSIVFSQENGLYEINTELDGEGENINYIDPYVEGKNIVLTGENHRFYGSNQLIKIKFILHLYKQGYRNFVLEFGSGIGFLFDQYVVYNNDEAYAILKQTFGNGNMPYKYFLDIIKDFNQDKSLEDKIRIHGVDYTRYPFYSLKALALIIQNQGCEYELKDYYEDLNVVSSGTTNIDDVGFFARRTPENFNLKGGFKTYNNRIFELSIRNLIQDYDRDTTRFLLALGPKFEQFNQLISDVRETLEWYKGEGVRIQSHIQRERYMARNIARIIQADSTQKVYGQFGRCHVRGEEFSQNCYGFDLTSIAERLEEMDTVLFKVESIPVFYVEEGFLKSNKSQSGLRTSKMLPLAKVYFYDYAANTLIFEKENFKLYDLAIINTFSSDASLEDILEDKKVKYPSRLAYYNGADSEDVFSFNASYANFTNGINSNFALDFYNPIHLSYGFGFRNITNDGGQSLFRFNMIQPINASNDSIDLRYTNYRFQLGGGYNFIHNRVFSLYSDLGLVLGFAKIRERRIPPEQIYTFNVKTEEVSYRNPYLGASLSLGSRIKIGSFSLFLESAYQRDFSDTGWRVKGSEVNGINPISFSNFIFFGGVAFAY